MTAKEIEKIPIRKEGAGSLSLVTIGCDPEFFFTSRGKVISSAKVLSQEGFINSHARIIRDGIQGEIVLLQGQTCREVVAMVLHQALVAVRAHLETLNLKHKGADLDFTINRAIVDIEDEEWETLNPDERQLGCQPSLNVYDPAAVVPDEARESRMRSAGGHIHLGIGALGDNEAHELVRLFDVLVGTMGVILDREPRASERRKAYGRAGEYRIQPHGIEYRTLSNFWLQDYHTLSLMFGLTKLIGSLWTTRARVRRQVDFGFRGEDSYYDSKKDIWTYRAFTRPHPDIITPLLKAVDQNLVQASINDNDLEGAWKTWEIIQEWVKEYFQDQTRTHGHQTPLWPSMLPGMNKWLKSKRELHPGYPGSSLGWETLALGWK